MATIDPSSTRSRPDPPPHALLPSCCALADTGPMFQKYNDVLREVGKVRTESKSYLSASEIEDMVGNMYTVSAPGAGA